MKKKEVNPQAQQEQFEIDNDIPFVVILGSQKYRVRRLKDWTANRISYEIAKKNGTLVSEGDDICAILNSMKSSGDLCSKIISLAVLGSWWKIKLFHPIFWRYISRIATQSDLNKSLSTIIDKLELRFFFLNMILLENMNQLRMKLARMEAQQYQAELESEQKQTS